MVDSIEQDFESIIGASMENLLDRVEKLPSTGNIDTMGLGLIHGFFMPDAYNSDDLFGRDVDAARHDYISHKVGRRLDDESTRGIEGAQWLASLYPTASAKMLGKPATVLGAGSMLGPEGFLFSVPVAALSVGLPGPIEAAHMIDSRYGSGKDRDIDGINIDYSSLRTALVQGSLDERLFDGDLYRPDWDIRDIDLTGKEAKVYGGKLFETDLSDYHDDLLRNDEVLLDDPILLEKTEEDNVVGKILVPAYVGGERTEEGLKGGTYSRTPAIEIDYTSESTDNLPVPERSYEGLPELNEVESREPSSLETADHLLME